MDQQERRVALIKYLLDESGIRDSVPQEEPAQKKLLRALLNVRMPKEASDAFIRLQNEYLQEELRRKGITDAETLSPVAPDIYLWKGDITLLKCDGIVNAANNRLLGCFYPGHGCIDNAIHTFSGIQLRKECDEIMKAQGCVEKTGQAKITLAYNLPCRYILHTVGPFVGDKLLARHKRELADSYRSCLALAVQNGLKSLAFCCVSTGEFRFPKEEAAKIAVEQTKMFLKSTTKRLKVIFNVFTEQEYEIYRRILS